MTDDFTEIVAVKYWKSGLLEVVREQKYPPRRGETPVRTDSRRWSKKSRKRLIALIAKARQRMQSMITLTFPEGCRISDGAQAKKILNRFLVRFRRRYVSVDYWWVLEFQTNGQPHFHVLCNVGESDIDRRWLGANWSQAVLYDPPERWGVHEAIAKRIYRVHAHKRAWEPFRRTDGAQRYLLTYVGKEAQKTPPAEYQNVGRWWGCSKGVRDDVSPDEVWPIDEHSMREVLMSWGMDWVASWDFLPQYIHVPPLLRRGETHD